jgi:pimeloyl-ACP methyl ester carboxylesterase
MSEKFCDVGRGITLCYETFGAEGDPPVLLVMGLATQMIGWPEEFCAQLASRGFYVVRFDNRDCGRSTRASGRPPKTGEILRRRIHAPAYTLDDMADDAAGLISELAIGPAHVVGASMGGMIAQTLAVRRPELVRSLVSIMSTTGSRWRGQPALRSYRILFKAAPVDREAYIEHMVHVFTVVGSPGFPRNLDRIRDVAARSYERGVDPAGSGRQLGAIIASGNRTPQLHSISSPTLVIHGSRDRLVSHSGGVATARAIPGARLMTVEGMGHDLPEGAWPQLLDAISAHARQADETAAATPAHPGGNQIPAR